MTTVRIHRFRLYDINSDSYRLSRRWATRDVIETIGGDIVPGHVAEVDAAVVSSDIAGMTALDFDPGTAAVLRRKAS